MGCSSWLESPFFLVQWVQVKYLYFVHYISIFIRSSHYFIIDLFGLHFPKSDTVPSVPSRCCLVTVCGWVKSCFKQAKKEKEKKKRRKNQINPMIVFLIYKRNNNTNIYRVIKNTKEKKYSLRQSKVLQRPQGFRNVNEYYI